VDSSQCGNIRPNIKPQPVVALVAGTTLLGGMRAPFELHLSTVATSLFVYVTSMAPIVTIATPDIQTVLRSAVGEILSDENHEQSLAFYRSWFEIGRTHFTIPSDQIFDAIWKKRTTDVIRTKHSQPASSKQASPQPDHVSHKLIHPTAHSILRFASDAESDHILASHNPGLQRRLCAKILQDFFSSNLTAMWHLTAASQEERGPTHWGRDPREREHSTLRCFYGDTNFIAHWANLGYVEEVEIHNHILQSLISYPKLHDHQADALIILFKLAGATFGAYADPSVVDRCFELLKANYARDSTDWELFQVRAFRIVKGNHWTKTRF
jgi:hypothetical protein